MPPHLRDASGPGAGCMWRAILVLAALGTWSYLLYGFVSTPWLIGLSIIGTSLLLAGSYLAVASAPHVAESPWYLASFTFGALLLAAAAATLAPAAPDRLLVTTASGWALLEQRIERLDRAIGAKHAWLARRLASRGVGSPDPLGADGRPILHDVTDGATLAALLDSGLDPDVRDASGRTLLWNTYDVEIARTLLQAGADPNAPTEAGFTVLDASLDKDPRILELLRAAGARNRPDPGAGIEGRRDWLVVEGDPGAAVEPSRITPERRPLLAGAVATLLIDLGNSSVDDQLLEVEARLGSAALFVGASHEGAIQNRAQPQLQQTIRWPRLALPAHSQGRLELTIVTRSDEAAGDLDVDVRAREVPGFEEAGVLQLYERLDASAPRAPVAGTGWAFPLGLMVLAAGAWAVFVRRLRSRPVEARVAARRGVGRIVAGLAGVLCLGVAAALLGSMLEPWLALDEAACTILDRRVLQRTVSRATGSRGPATVYAVPLAAVRIETSAGVAIATGFATGMATRSVQELRGFPLGGTVPCWVDPDDVTRFTLVRSPSLAGIVGVLMLVATGLGLALAARALRI